MKFFVCSNRWLVGALVLGGLSASGCDPHGCPTGMIPQPDGTCVLIEAEDAGVDAPLDASASASDDARAMADAFSPDAFMPDAFLVIPDGCVPQAYWNDNDADGFGDAAMPSILACVAPANYVTNGDDCNDTNAGAHPGATETCNGIDDNCDGSIDEMLRLTVYRDEDGDHFGSATTSLECPDAAGWATASGDCDDMDANRYPTRSEVCNGIDDNCDGQVDEMRRIPVVRDADGDGFGTSEASLQCPGAPGWATSSGDCDDTNSAINPFSHESCNGLDDNCNGSIDEMLLVTLYRDLDGDGFGTSGGLQCPGTAGWAPLVGDCDDTNRNVNPGRVEVCNGIDDNCAMGIDEMLLQTFYEDGDMDGYGARASTPMCSAPPNYVARAGDCDDTASTINPSRSEVCNGIDDNCNSAPDETFACVLGRSYSCRTSCGTTGGYVCPAGCAIPACTPPVEACNYADDDCDDYVDEGASTWRGPTTAALSTRRVELLATASGFVRVLARSTGVYAQSYDRNGAPTGAEVQLSTTQPANFAASVRDDSLFLVTYAASVLLGHEFSATTLAPRTTNVNIANSLGTLTRLRIVANDARVFIVYSDSIKVEMMVRDRAWVGSGVVRVHDGAIDLDLALGEEPTQAYVAISVTNGVQLTRIDVAGTVTPLFRHITSASTRYAQVAIGKLPGGRPAVGIAFHDNAGLASNVHFALYEVDSPTTVAPRGELTLEAITPATTALEGAMDLVFNGGRFTAAWLTSSGTDWHMSDIRPISGAPTGVLTTIPLGAATTSLALASGEEGKLLALHAQAGAAARSWFRGCP